MEVKGTSVVAGDLPKVVKTMEEIWNLQNVKISGTKA